MSIQIDLKTFFHMGFQFGKTKDISRAWTCTYDWLVGTLMGVEGDLRYSFVGPNPEGLAPGKPFGERSWQRPSPLTEEPGVCAARRHT